MNTIQLGYIDKDVVFKNFTKLFEFDIVSLKNYSISPRVLFGAAGFHH